MAFLAVKRVSDLDVIDQPRASQTTGGKRHERHADALRGREIRLLSHRNIVDLPAACGQRGQRGVFQSGDVVLTLSESLADALQFPIEARGFGALGCAQVAVA
jgi:hypothetical protein